MIFLIFTILTKSNPKENNIGIKVMKTVDDVKRLSHSITKIQFDSSDSIEQIDKDAINLALEETKIAKSFNFLTKFLKNSEDNFIKSECNNCIKVLSQNALFIFRAIRKSTINTVNFYQSTDSSCSVKDVQLIFYNDNFVNYTSEIYHLRPKSLNVFHFKQNITFENVHVNATSNNPSLLCLSKFSLLIR